MKHILAAACGFLAFAAHASADPAETPPAAPDRLSETDELYFDRRASLLHLSRPIDDPNVEQVMFVFSAFTYGDVGVTVFLERRPELMDHNPIVMLSASWIDSRKKTHKTYGEVERMSSVTDLYDVRISLAEFNAIKKSLSDGDFYSEPPKTKSDVELGYVCLDGAAYYIEARFPDQNHLIARHSCYQDYEVSGKHAVPLLQFARKKIPALRDTLNKVESMITNE